MTVQSNISAAERQAGAQSRLSLRLNLPCRAARIADSNSTNAVNISSARPTKRFPSLRIRIGTAQRAVSVLAESLSAILTPVCRSVKRAVTCSDCQSRSPDRLLKFEKRSQFFIGPHNEALSVSQDRARFARELIRVAFVTPS
jgi:hypothetical protein